MSGLGGVSLKLSVLLKLVMLLYYWLLQDSKILLKLYNFMCRGQSRAKGMGGRQT